MLNSLKNINHTSIKTLTELKKNIFGFSKVDLNRAFKFHIKLFLVKQVQVLAA